MSLSFKDLYKTKVVPKLKEEFGYKNVHEIPKLEKIVINMGVGEAVFDSKVINHAVNDLTQISGQKPVITKAKVSVASYKLREGMNIGCKVTLRKDRMFEFIERLVYIALPRSQDFKGFNSKSFDSHGNFSFGLKEQVIFSEIKYDKIDQTRGMDITFVTTAKNKKEAKALLEGLNLPFYN